GDDRPEVAFLRLATPGIEHRCRGFVHEQTICPLQMATHVVRYGLEMEAGAAGPVAQCRPIKPDPLPSIDLGLTVTRRMGAEVARRTLSRRAPGWALDHSLGFLLSRVQDALRDLHVFQRQVILIWP